MQGMMIRHKVNDYGVWKPYFDADKPRQEAAGLHVAELLRSLDDPNEVVIWFQMDDVDQARAFVQDPRLREVMMEAGVAEHPTIMFLEVIEKLMP
jgi:quinol monooxygenase YgiN